MRGRFYSSWHKLLISLFALALLVILIAFFWRNNAIVFVTLTIATISVLFPSRRRREEIIPFIVAFILGPSMEAVIIRFGAWQYTNPSFGGIPIWLPLLWGLTGVFLMKIVRWFNCNSSRNLPT